MSVSIIVCPSCNTPLLPDTAQCPTCHHVLIEGRPAAELGAIPVSATDSADAEDACPGCNELVRRGLVRCWNCGTFMRDEIAQSYQRMQANPSRVIYSELPDETGESPSDDEPPAVQSVAAADVDFELAPDLAADDDFETAPSLMPREDAIVASAPTMGQAPPPEVEPTPPPAKKSKSKPAAVGKPAAEAKKSGDSSPKTAPADPKTEFESEFETRFGHHSMATGGEGLLQVALAEEAETGVRKRRRGDTGVGRGGFVVFCPHGHRIEVQERHRGLTGRCPRCREPFAVPANPWDDQTADGEARAAAARQSESDAAESAAAEARLEISAGEYTRWLTDVHHHTVNVTKLKLKAGSLLNDFQEADLAFSPNGLLKIVLVKKGGLFGNAAKKKDAVRKAVVDHLSAGKELDDLPGAAHQFYDLDAVAQIRVVQPIASADESMFAGVPVFGDGRIAVRFPKIDDSSDPQFASFALSGFREFASILDEFCGIKNFGAECGIPLDDVFTERVCHFSDAHLRILEHVDFYRNDPGFKLKLIGRRCQGCGLVVSEESRQKEKLGGKNGKGIAKAKCPKCEKPFGEISLFAFDDAPAPAPANVPAS